jgi:hypothetical protein
MKSSMKLALSAGAVWILLIWVTGVFGFQIWFEEVEETVQALLAGLSVVWAIYLLSRSDIGQKTKQTRPSQEKTGYPSRAEVDLWNTHFDELVDLNGCGPATAERIIVKIKSRQPLTDREQKFWSQVQ